MTKAKKTILLFLVIFGIVSCRKNSGPSWDTQILAPLIKTTLSINNIVTGVNTVNNSDSSVTLVLHDSLYSLNLDSLLRIPDTTLANVYGGIPFQVAVSPGQSILPAGIDSVTNYNIGSANLTRAVIKSGFVKFKVESTILAVTDFSYVVPSATKSGPLFISLKVPAAISNSNNTARIKGVDSLIMPLDGYSVDFTGPLHNAYNTIITRLTGILDPSAGTYNLWYKDSVIITATFYNIVPEYGQGYFGESKKTIGPSKSVFSLFNKITGGNLNLKNVNVDFTLENGFGVDGRLYIDSLISMNPRPGGTNIPLTASIVHNAININRAKETAIPSSPVIPSIQSFSLNSSNSNIIQWIDNLPTAIDYKLQLTTDPLGNVSGNTDFAYYGYGIKTYFDISVPLYLAANNLTLEDTMPVSFATSSQAKQIKSGTFTLYASNLFPFSAGLQIYLLDNNMHIVDSILGLGQTIAAGIPNANGMVTTPDNSVLTIPLDSYHANLLFTTKNIIVKATFNTGCSTCTPVKYSKIYDTYQLNIKLIGNFDYQVKG